MLRGYDPLKEISHWHLIISLLTCEFLLGVVALNLVHNQTSLIKGGSWLVSLSFCLLLACVVAPLILIIRHHREKKQRSLLRQNILNGDRQFLVPIQPPPLAQALTPPIRIESRFRRFFIALAILGASALAGALALSTLAILNNSSWTIFSFFLPMVSTIVAGLVVIATVAIQGAVAGHYLLPSLQVDEESITARYGRDTISMHWADVRYFALASSETFRGSEKREAFELSDGENMLCWLVAAPFGSYELRRAGEVWLSAQDYATFTHQLASWIVAKTDGPLYDLRTAKQKQQSSRSLLQPGRPQHNALS